MKSSGHLANAVSLQKCELRLGEGLLPHEARLRVRAEAARAQRAQQRHHVAQQARERGWPAQCRR